MTDNAVEDGLVQKYLSRQLAEEELDEFELRLLEDPQLFAQVESEAALQRAVRVAGQGGAMQPKVTVARGLAALRQWIGAPSWLLGASALAVTASLCLSLGLALGAHQDSLVQGELLDRIVYLDELRSSEAQASVELAARERVVLAIDAIAWDGVAEVRITLEGEGHSVEYPAAVVGDDYQLLLPLSRLAPGVYRLTVQGGGSERSYKLIAH